MSLIIQALEKLERTEDNYKELNNFLLKNLKKGTEKEKKRVIILSISALSLSLLSAFFVNIYSNYQRHALENDKTIISKNSEQTTNSLIIPEEVPSNRFNMDSLNITEKEIVSSLAGIDLSLLDEINRKNTVEYSTSHEEKKESISENVSLENHNKSKFLSLVWMAEESYREGDYQKSIEYYEKAYSIEKNRDILSNLLILYIQAGNTDRVIRLLELEKNPELTYSTTIEMIDRGMYREAEKIIYRFIPYDRNGNLYYALGYLYELQNRIEKAVNNYRKAYSMNPQDQYFAYAYGRILEMTGRREEAKEIFSKLMLRDDLDREIKISLLEYYR